MQITVPVYQQRREQGLQWSTVGLGDLSATRTLGTEAKLKRWLHDTLKEATRNERRALLQLFGPASVRLKRVRLELSFKVRGKKKKTGLFPIILDPRFRTQSERLVLAYHPLRQNDVLIVNEDSLEDQLAPFLAHAWREVPDEDLNALLSDGRDRLRAIAMTLNPPSLLDQLQQQKSPWADLEIDPKREREKDRARKKKKGGPPPILRRLSVDLTERAASGALDAGRPREPLRSQIQQLLCVPRRSPLVLIGPTGAGKRTALRRAVADLLSYEGYDAHRNLDRVTHVYSLSGSRIIAGMSFLGQWEQRCVDILEATQGRRVVLFFEDLHTLGRVGRSRDSERSIGDFFRGPLDRGEVVIIGTATASQWHRLEEDVPSFAAAFTRLRVDPATSDETLRMLLHEARAIESEQRCTFDVEVFRGILEVGAPLLVDQALPGKALDLLRLLARDEGGATRTGVEMDHVLGALSRKTGLYMDVLDKASDLAREDVIHTLQLDVMGQPSATEAVADLIVRIRAGLTDPGRPYGTYLFTGPTGTGKTQLAKALSSYLYDSEDADRLIRFDMGELSGPDAVARLIGDRWSPRGLLTEAVRQEPFCVLLLDEIEKAHRSVLYLLLQLLDDGRLTDAAGDRVDFTRSVIIMTSNLGASPRAAVGFESGESSIRSDVQKAVKEFFPPELFNRIERIVAFEPLSNDTAKSIVEKELTQLLGRRGLTERNVFVFANASASERMVTEAFDSRAGARSVKRYLETRIGTLLAEHLASTARPEMEIIRLYDADGEYRLTSSALREAQPLEGTLALGPLLHASSPALAKALPAVLQDLQSLEEGGALEVLAERLRTHLALVGGSEEHADAVYYLDLLRGDLQSFREHVDAFVHAAEIAEEQSLELAAMARSAPPEKNDGQLRQRRVRLVDHRWYQTPMPRQDRREMLAALAEHAFLMRALSDPERGIHQVTVELLRVGHARRRVALGLFNTLTTFYAGWRGELISAAARLASGEIAIADGPSDLPSLLQQAPDQLALTLGGVDLYRWLQGEHGCHVWNAVTRGSEVVRVRILPEAKHGADFLREHQDAQKRYERALESGVDPLPEDPERLLPVVRRIRFDPGRGPAPFEIEDYPLQHVERGNTRTITEVLPAFLWLRMSHQEPS